jgi:hypothetical protein
MNRKTMIEALQRVRQGEQIHPNTARSLVDQHLIRKRDEGGYALLEDGEIALGAKLVIQQSKQVKDETTWETIGIPYPTRVSAEDAARLRSVTDETDYRIILEGAIPTTFVVYSYGVRYVQNISGMRTRETEIVRPTGEDDEPLHLFAVERNQGSGWERIGDRLYTSQSDAEEAASTVSKTKQGDYCVVPDDCPPLPPVMWRGGRKLPNIYLLEDMGEIGGGTDLIRALIQVWTGD